MEYLFDSSSILSTHSIRDKYSSFFFLDGNKAASSQKKSKRIKWRNTHIMSLKKGDGRKKFLRKSLNQMKLDNDEDDAQTESLSEGFHLE